MRDVISDDETARSRCIRWAVLARVVGRSGKSYKHTEDRKTVRRGLPFGDAKCGFLYARVRYDRPSTLCTEWGLKGNIETTSSNWHCQ